MKFLRCTQAISSISMISTGCWLPDELSLKTCLSHYNTTSKMYVSKSHRFPEAWCNTWHIVRCSMKAFWMKVEISSQPSFSPAFLLVPCDGEIQTWWPNQNSLAFTDSPLFTWQDTYQLAPGKAAVSPKLDWELLKDGGGVLISHGMPKIS